MGSQEISEFLGGGEFLALQNPALDAVDLRGLPGELPDLAGHCLFRTSGTEGNPKFVALSREALLASAASVNRRFEIGPLDRWLRVLPMFHVGGFGIHVRGFVAGCGVDEIPGRWDPKTFWEGCGRLGSTLTSLVPTQVSDLVAGQFSAPSSLRAVMVGGGALDPEVGRRAAELGWPLVPTYGMTETASQVAAGDHFVGADEVGEKPLRLLDGWEVKSASGGALELRGKALFSGYVREREGRLAFEDPKDRGGWFRSSDRVELTGGGLVFRGRRTDEVKVLGELVDLGRIQQRVDELAVAAGIDARDLLVVALPDQRRGSHLVLADATRSENSGKLLDELNRMLAGFERIQRREVVDAIPRGALGKPLRRKLERQLRRSGGG